MASVVIAFVFSVRHPSLFSLLFSRVLFSVSASRVYTWQPLLRGTCTDLYSTLVGCLGLLFCSSGAVCHSFFFFFFEWEENSTSFRMVRLKVHDGQWNCCRKTRWKVSVKHICFSVHPQSKGPRTGGSWQVHDACHIICKTVMTYDL